MNRAGDEVPLHLQMSCKKVIKILFKGLDSVPNNVHHDSSDDVDANWDDASPPQYYFWNPNYFETLVLEVGEANKGNIIRST